MVSLNKVYKKDAGTVNAVYEIVRGKIIGWEYLPHLQLSEQKISDELGISRTPVREAFIKLSAEGLVETRPYRGTFVTPVEVQQVAEAQFIRSCLECEITEIVCAMDAAKYIKYAKKNIAQQRTALQQKDIKTFTVLDDAFHKELFLFCNKEMSWQVVQNISAQYQRLRNLLADKPHLPDEHEAIVDAIEAKDGATAKKWMKIHLGNIAQELNELRLQYPDYFAQESTG